MNLDHIMSKGLGEITNTFCLQKNYVSGIFEAMEVRGCCEVTTVTNDICSVRNNVIYLLQ